MCLFFSKFFSCVFRKKELLLVIAGLEYAGKTTILYRLKKEKPPMEGHTIGHNVETVEYNNIKFVFMDVSIRVYRPNESRMWKHFFYMSHALIFVVDSSDHEHVMEAKDELHKLWNHDELKYAVLLVFANKQDEPNAMNVEDLTDKLDLHSLKDNRHWHIQSTCATSGDGLYQGLEWIANNRSHR